MHKPLHRTSIILEHLRARSLEVMRYLVTGSPENPLPGRLIGFETRFIYIENSISAHIEKHQGIGNTVNDGLFPPQLKGANLTQIAVVSFGHLTSKPAKDSIYTRPSISILDLRKSVSRILLG
jgi:hypothetical protein